jgi:hypothetical protein
LRKQEGSCTAQILAPNLLGRHGPTGEQISSPWYSKSYPGINQHSPLDRLTTVPLKKKKKTNDKQETEKEHAAEVVECSECMGQGGRDKRLISA